jgi:uncharacterized protein
VSLFPDTCSTHGIGSIRSIRDFDEYITAPYSGFEGADDYYFRASSGKVVSRITIPTLVLHALDDPFIRITAETRETLLRNMSIQYVESPYGGHCGLLATVFWRDGYLRVQRPPLGRVNPDSLPDGRRGSY